MSYHNVVLRSCIPADLNRLNICHFNANSLFYKMNDVRRIVSGTKINIIGVSETWLLPSDTSKSISLPGFSSFRQDRPNTVNRGGGVLLYVRKRFRTKVVRRSTADGIEYIFVEVSLNSTKVLIACVYIPYPSITLLNVFKEELTNLNLGLYEDVVLMGDFNINLLSITSISRRYLQILDQFSLSVVNDKEPTHFSIPTSSCSLIDHIVVRTQKLSSVRLSSQLFGVSHHDLIYISYDVPIPSEPDKLYSFRDYKRCNLPLLYHDAHLINWNDMYASSDVDTQVELFTTKIYGLLELHLPLRRRINNMKIPWFDPKVEQAIAERDIAHAKWRNQRNPINWSNYKRLRNRAVYLSRVASRRYSFKILDPKLNAKVLWNNLGNLGLTNQTDASSSLFSPDEFNSYFLSMQTPSTNNLSLQLPVNRNQHDFSFSNISCAEVLNAIFAVKSNAIGPDNIPPKFLKLIVYVILPQITFLFNSVITKSHYPKLWKIAKVIPVPKKNTPSGLCDFRPISLLSFLSKALEKVLKKEICNYIYNCNLLSKFQSGFREKHSTTTALLKVTGDIRKNIDNRYVTFLILLDFSKAFDTVNWSILCEKLSLVGFSTSAVKLMLHYLSNRTQYVGNSDGCSTTLPLTSGVPQGSILGPLLFSIFINDLPSVLNCSYHMFADDVQIYMACKLGDISICISNMNHELSKITGWVSRNKLSLNVNKTQAIAIYCTNLDTSMFPPLKLLNQTIPYVSKVKNLGLTITSTLSWDKHINLISSKVYFLLRRLSRFAYLTPYDTKLKLAKSILMPQFTYCDAVLGSLDAASLSRLNSIFNACTRYVCGLQKYDHISSYSNVILGCSFSNYIKYRHCYFLYKLLNKKSPTYLFDEFTLSSSDRTNNLIIPKFKFKHLQSSYVVYGSSLWNSLPHAIKHCSSEAAFRVACFKHFSLQ